MTKKLSLTKLSFLCGAIAGPLFILTVLIQDYTRSGFNARTDMLSLLSLGSLGWIQIANFMITGILDLLYVIGLRRLLHPGPAGTWAPILIGIHGLGLVTVGIFRTDPASGFPPGVPSVTQPSWHGAIHALGALFVFVSLAIALIVLARMFFASRAAGWAAYCLASSISMLVAFFGGFTNASIASSTLRLGVLIGWMASSIVAMGLLTTKSVRRPVA